MIISDVVEKILIPIAVALMTYFLQYGIPHKKMFCVIAKFIKNVPQKLKLLKAKIRKLLERFVGIEALKQQHKKEIEELRAK